MIILLLFFRTLFQKVGCSNLWVDALRLTTVCLTHAAHFLFNRLLFAADFQYVDIDR